MNTKAMLSSLTVIAIVLSINAAGIHAEEESYEESKTYVGSLSTTTHAHLCNYAGINFGDYAPFDCIGSVFFDQFPDYGEYQVFINDSTAASVGAFWMYCEDDQCPEIMYAFCDSTTVSAGPETTIFVHLRNDAYLSCDAPPAVEGTVTVREI